MLAVQNHQQNQTLAQLPRNISPLVLAKVEIWSEIQKYPLSSLLNGGTDELQMSLLAVRQNVSIESCLAAPTIAQTIIRNQDAEKVLFGMVVFIIWQFQNSLKVDKCLNSAEICELAGDYMERFKHESIDDLIQALKTAKQSGRKFYNKFSGEDFWDILLPHFEEKAIAVENEHRRMKYAEKEIGAATVDEEIQKVREEYKKLWTVNEDGRTQYEIETAKIKSDLTKQKAMQALSKEPKFIPNESYFEA